MMDCDPVNQANHPRVVFGHGVYYSNKKLTRTNIESLDFFFLLVIEYVPYAHIFSRQILFLFSLVSGKKKTCKTLG